MAQHGTILLIDDDPLVHMSYHMALFASKYNKVSIQDQEEALKYPEHKQNYDRPNLIFVDLMLGQVNGLDVIKLMRKDPYFDKIPIILHTGYAQGVSDTSIIKDLNILHILLKPCLKEELLACIDIYMYYFEKNATSS